MTGEDKHLHVIVPWEIWLSLRRMQERGEIRSIKDAAIQGLRLLIAANKEGGKNDN